MIKIKKRSCPFCRQPEPKSAAEIEHYKMKRRKANDPVAIQGAGKRRYHDGDYERAFEYFSKAIEVEAGDAEAEAHYCLSFMYRDGKGIGRDAQKRVYHLEEAAIGGHPKARHDLGVHEVYQGRIEIAARHFIISANLGHDASLKALRELRAAGEVGHEDFVTAFRAHQAAVNATKSRQRAEALAIGAMQIVDKSRSNRANAAAHINPKILNTSGRNSASHARASGTRASFTDTYAKRNILHLSNPSLQRHGFLRGYNTYRLYDTYSKLFLVQTEGSLFLLEY
eukprot:scaffold36657_cov66-Skeletonema_marinoi.AAC.1